PALSATLSLHDALPISRLDLARGVLNPSAVAIFPPAPDPDAAMSLATSPEGAATPPRPAARLGRVAGALVRRPLALFGLLAVLLDRKSTRLNSSHVKSS